MELITILNHCHHNRGFVYQHARFGSDQKSIEVDVRPREGSAAVCSGCHQPAPGYDHLPERCFEFIPLWGFLVFLLYRMRRVDCRKCGVVVEEVPWGDGWLGVWLAIWISATVVLAAWEVLRSALLSIKTAEGPVLTSRYARVVYASGLGLVAVVMRLLLNQPAPSIVYKTF
jgi:hypothetical protein